MFNQLVQKYYLKKEGKGYNSNSIIGKVGLEYAYEDKIRGIDGVEIYIEDSEGNRLKELAKQDKKRWARYKINNRYGYTIKII